jgi:uncharacterized RDD family membrane protein YckC
MDKTASFNRRILAIGIDLLIMTLLLIPTSLIVDFVNRILQTRVVNFDTELMLQNISINTFFEILYQSGILVQVVITQIIHFCIVVSYYTICISKYGTTPGKKLLHCQIINATTRCKPSIQQAFIRSIIMPFSMLFVGIGLIMIEFTKKNQALHDKIAGTLVIYDKKD